MKGEERRERAREADTEKEKSDTRVITGKAENYFIPNYSLTELKSAANFWVSRYKDDN